METIVQLADTIRKDLPLVEFHRNAIAVIDNHDFSGVKRKTKADLAKLGIDVTDEYLDAGILALKQYYAIAVLDGNNMHAVSDKVDPFWHAHMLHSKIYEKFCHDVVGEMMHHSPLDHDKPADVQFVAGLYRFTMEQYGKCFLHIDERFHPNPDVAGLVCTHAGDMYASGEHALFPKVAHAQAPASWI